MSYTPDTTPFFVYTNNADFNVPGNSTSYLPSNLNSVYENQTYYDSSTNSIISSKCSCNFDFLGTVTDQRDSPMYHRIWQTDKDPEVSFLGLNTSPYKGWGGRVDDMITSTGSTLRLEFYRSSYVSNSTVTVQQHKLIVSGINLS